MQSQMNKQILILVIPGILLSFQLYGQVSIPNNGFEQSDNSSQTKTANWKAESDNFICIQDNAATYKGTYSLKISSKTEGNHFFNEEFPFTSHGLRKYK